ncbi:hypothetical protein CCH79_00014624, partial [Gambusia affinis]
IYVCSKCDHELFSSRSKYEHSSPWPAFTETIHENSVKCGKCGNGLGHEFVNDGPAKGIRSMDSKLFSSTSKFEHSSPETIHEDIVSRHPEAWGPIKR